MVSGPPSHGLPSVSVVIPVRNDAQRLDQCLTALAESDVRPIETIVIDDGSTDESGATATRHGAHLIRLEQSGGPAHARNRGAEIARGDLLFFVDADVVVQCDTVRTAAGVLADESLAAVIGSYDDAPGDPGFVSQYKNLFHHWVHQTSNEEAWTFWSGCGAVRRSVFLAMGGFNEGYPKPSIEDIEFGFRLRAADRRIRLEKTMLAKHMKQWTLFNLIRTDIFQRGVPWIALMMRDRFAASDLNISAESRWSTVLTYMGTALLLMCVVFPGVLFPWTAIAAISVLALVVVLHHDLYRFFATKRGLSFALRVVPMHLLFFLYSGLCIPFGMIAHSMDRRRAERTARGPGVRTLEPLEVNAVDAGGAGP